MNKNNKFKKLNKTIKGTEKAIQEKKIKIIRIKAGQKIPQDKGYFDKELSLKEIQNHKGNFGVCVGYKHEENGYSLACIDIDGFKYNTLSNTQKKKMPRKIKENFDKKSKKELQDIAKRSKDYLFKSLIRHFHGAMVSITQSGGYHIFVYNKTVPPDSLTDIAHYISKQFKFPQNCEIKDLRELPLLNSIEIFTKEKSKQVVLPTSEIRLKGEKRQYTLMKDKNLKNNWYELQKVEDINKTVENALKKEGYIRIKKRKKEKKQKTEPKHAYYTHTGENKEIINILTRIIAHTKGQHNLVVPSLAGGFQRLDLDLETVIEWMGTALERADKKDKKEHIKQVKSSYKSLNKQKTGFNRIIYEFQDPRITDLIFDLKKNLNIVLKEKGKLYISQLEFGRYTQKNKNLIEITTKTIINDDGTRSKKTIQTNIACIAINFVEVVFDLLNIEKLYINVEYYDGLQEKLINKKKLHKEEVASLFYDSCCFFVFSQFQIEKLINTIIHSLKKDNLLNIKYEVSKKGFFLQADTNDELIKDKEGKYILLENSIYKDEPKPTKDQISTAIELINALIRDKSIINDCKYIIFALNSPFHWCMKQLGYGNNTIKGIMSYGEANTGKTEFMLFLKWLYEDPLEYNASADTLSSMCNVLSQTTFFTLFDDSHNLISYKGVKGALKKGIIGKYYRTVSDQNDYTKNQEYLALSTPVFTFNESYKLTDGLQRRIEAIQYTSTMQEPLEGMNDFNEKYMPLSPESKLKPLKYLGIAFKSKIKPYLVSGSKEVHNINRLTIKILKEIQEEAGTLFNPELLKEHKSDTDLNEDRGAKLRKALNKLFRDNKKSGKYNNKYELGDFIYCAENNVFDWLFYQKRNKLFVIEQKSFKNECERLINSTLDWDLIKKFFRLEEVENIQNELKENHKGTFDALNWSETAEGWSWSSCNVELVEQCKAQNVPLRNCIRIYKNDLPRVIFSIHDYYEEEETVENLDKY